MTLSAVAARVHERHLTYLAPSKLESLYEVIAAVKSDGVEGDFLDFGIALGGSAICIASELDGPRRFFGFDLSGMIPAPSTQDGEDAPDRDRVIAGGEAYGIAGTEYYGYIDSLYDVVCKIFAEFGLPVDGDRIRLIRGRLDETLPISPEIRIALVHIDCDRYESVLYCLEYVYPRLVPGGFIILNDYDSWDGCRKATEEFCHSHIDLIVERTQPHAVIRKSKTRLPGIAASSTPALDNVLLGRWTGHYGFDGRAGSALFRAGESRLRANPMDAEGWALVGRASHLVGEARFAAEALAKAVDNGHPDKQVALYLARLQCETGDPGAAAATLAALSDPEPDGAAFVRGICQLTAGDARAALRAFAAEAARPGEYTVPAVWARQYIRTALGMAAEEQSLFACALAGRGTPATIADDCPIVTVLDYKSPDLRCCTDNLGDYIQTHAVLCQLARMPEIEWRTADPALPALLAELRGTVSSVAHGAGSLCLDVLDRDALWLDAARFAGRRVWALVYGWHYHRLFGGVAPFPAPANIEPIVFSFHLADPSLLDRPMLDWLQRFSPIGCRDWNTCAWLLNQGVDAFFSGCVTATLPPMTGAARVGRFSVDLPDEQIPPDMMPITHAEQGLRVSSFGKAMRRCRERLAQYALAEAVRTSRLHCYMPCRALGTPVEFHGVHPADLRYEGLVGIGDDALAEMADNLARSITGVIAEIAAGADVGRIRGFWRDANAASVANARTRLGIFDSKRRTGERRLAACGALSETVHLTMCCTPDTAEPALTTLRSALRNTKARIDATVLASGFGSRALAAFACDIVAQHERSSVTAVSPRGDLGPLRLAALLSQVDRVVHLAPGCLVRGDIAELGAYDPGTTGVVARPCPAARQATMAHAIEHRAVMLDPARAHALRIATAARLDLSAPYPDPGVSVLSLETLRRCDVPNQAGSLAAQLEIDEWLALLLTVGGEFQFLPAEWNANPYAELCDTAKLICWSGDAKPWILGRDALMAGQWHRQAEQAEGSAAGVGMETTTLSYVLTPPFALRRGSAWTAMLPSDCRALSADQRAKMVLREDGRRLGPGNAMEADICGSGAGRFSVWPKAVCFSTSDGSDPNANGRTYTIELNRPRYGGS